MRPSVFPPSSRALHHLILRAISAYLVVVSGVVTASPTLSLDETRRVAGAEAPSVAAQSARVSAAREEAARAAALPDPTLQLGVDNLTVTGADALRLGADEMTMRRIGVMQEWPSRRKRQARQAAADAQLDTVASEAQAMRLAVERSAGNAWLETWAAETERGLLQELLVEAERAVDIARAQLANATGSATDVLAAQVVRTELDNELHRADAQVQGARAGLTRWVPAAASAVLDSPPDFASLRDPPERLRATLHQHAHLQVWAGRVRAAETAVALAQAEKRPDLGFGVSYGARSAGLPDMMMVEVSIGLPLFARGRQDRGIAARLAERTAVEAEREDALREQRAALERELATWEGLRDERDRYARSLLPLARDRSAVALAGYGAGGEIRPWIEARRDELAIRRRYVDTQTALGRAWLALDTLLPRDDSTDEVQP